jgi:hypothetical protein
LRSVPATAQTVAGNIGEKHLRRCDPTAGFSFSGKEDEPFCEGSVRQPLHEPANVTDGDRSALFSYVTGAKGKI